MAPGPTGRGVGISAARDRPDLRLVAAPDRVEPIVADHLRDDRGRRDRGVVIFGVGDGVAEWARFYLEPVQAGDGDADAAVFRQVTPGGLR